jgi:predicted transporter
MTMYMDAVVIAGIGTVVLMVGFFVGVGVFVARDARHHHDEGRHGR